MSAQPTAHDADRAASARPTAIGDAPTRIHHAAPASLTLTHAHDGGLVVFRIGMTVQRPLRPDLWGPVVIAMPRMIRELERNRDAAARGEEDDLGFLGAEYALGTHGPEVTQFWRTTAQLYAYAHMADRTHLPAWREFNARARTAPGAVGIWHETYAVPAAGIETLYGNGAVVGLGALTGTVPVLRRGRRARDRMGAASASGTVPAP